jgi:PAS domain S-box-containing protein
MASDQDTVGPSPPARRGRTDGAGRPGPAEGQDASAALDRLRRTYDALFEASADMVLVADLESGRILRANAAAEAGLERPRATLQQMTVWDLVAPEEHARITALVARSLRDRRFSVRDRFLFRPPDGTSRRVVADVEVVVPGPEPQVHVIIRDLTETEETKRRLEETEDRFRRIVDQAGDALYLHDRQGRFVLVNQQACRMLGYTREELLRLTVRDVSGDFDAASYEEVWRRARVEGTVTMQGRLRHKDGTAFPHEVRVGLMEWGGQTLMLALARDVTERNRAEEALRHSQQRYRAVVEDQTELICRWLPTGELTFVNGAYGRYFGKTAEDLVGRTFMPLILPEDQPRVARHFASLTRDQPVATHEHRVLSAAGEVRWMQWTNRAIFDEAGTLLEYQAVGRDITDRRRAEEALRESEANYRLLFNESADGIVVVVEGRLVNANPAACRLFGWAPGEFAGRTPMDYLNLFHPDDRPLLRERFLQIMAGEPVQTTYAGRLLRPDGTIAWIEARTQPIRWEGRAAYQSMVRDVTERVHLEERLREAQKMEAVGQLAGGVAHDFNNLVTGILCHANLIRDAATPGEAVHEAAKTIEEAARRAAELTGQLLGFARRGKLENVPVDLAAAIAAAVALVGPTLGEKVRVTRRIRTPRPLAMGDPGQLQQVVLNLVLNARDAMPDGGDLAFQVDEADLDAPGAPGPAARPDAAPGRYVVLSVSDTGRGIAAEVRHRIFEPFFTTKPPGQGLGMGLAVVYGIVRNHGGWVEVESEVGRGTTLRVHLPAAPEGAEVAPPAAPGPTVRRAGRILVVEDEEVVRRAVEQMLTRAGYEVMTASNGREAVACYAAHAGRLDLVIIDLRMPEMDGRACFRELKRLDPGVKAIVSTGYEADGAAQEMLDQGMVGFVRKPYQMEDLLGAVASALGRTSAAAKHARGGGPP